MKLVIVGGVAGGASAAARARRLAEDAEIVLFERGPEVSFANCGLPYYLGGEITDRQKLLIVAPQQLRTRFKLDVRTRTSVESIDRVKKVVRVRDLARGREYEESYDKLILRRLAAPLLPDLPGVDLPGVFTLRNLQDTDRIQEALDKGVRRAIILGGGFIGLELAENLVRRGIVTTIVQRGGQVLKPLDAEMTTPVVQQLRQHGVELLLGQTAEAIEPCADGLRVRLQSGRQLTAPLVLVGIGVRPESRLAVAGRLGDGAGRPHPRQPAAPDQRPGHLRRGRRHRSHRLCDRPAAHVPLAGPANRQGRLAADHAFGRPVRYRGTQGTAIVRVFQCTAAITGASEKVLRRAGRSYRKVYVHPAHHAGYYPGAECWC